MEDSTYNIFVLKELLKSITERTIDVETALNGKIAIELLLKSAADRLSPFDLILLDLQMPVLDGFQVTLLLLFNRLWLGLRSSRGKGESTLNKLK